MYQWLFQYQACHLPLLSWHWERLCGVQSAPKERYRYATFHRAAFLLDLANISDGTSHSDSFGHSEAFGHSDSFGHSEAFGRASVFASTCDTLEVSEFIVQCLSLQYFLSKFIVVQRLCLSV